MTNAITRLLVGLCISGAVALAAHRARALSVGGTATAMLVGTLAVAAGWAWGVLLIAYFVVSIGLSRVRGAEKEIRTASVVAKRGPRDARQVMANGALFTIAALSATLAVGGRAGTMIATALALGALAASAADTWATEIGSLARRPPRSIINAKPVPPGTSGGVNLLGVAAMAAGAGFVAMGAHALGIDAPRGAVLIGGVCGAIADSVIGATVQERRWCDACQAGTERPVHSCGRPTRHAGGLSGVDNDLVNLIATAVGGTVAALVASS